MIDISFWQAVLIALIFTHITIVSVTLYLHRCQSHRAVKFHAVLSHFMRAWLWLTTGMNTKLWVAIHRKHHQVTDRPGDPHSPHVFGLHTVMTTGYYLYNQAVKDADFVMQYGKGTPKDWIERKLYTPHVNLGVVLMLVIDLALFGPWGVLIWVFQMAWIPVMASGLINGLGHWWGYRNGPTKDHSTNIFPLGIVMAGEELHNNHHLAPASPRFSRRWWEFDIGWFWIQVLIMLGLARLTK